MGIRNDCYPLLTLFFVIGILFLIEFVFLDLFYLHYMRRDFRTNDVNMTNVMIMESEKFEDKIYFVGDSILWGTALKDNETIPSNFARECNITVFNLALRGAYFQDNLELIKRLDNDTAIFLEVNPVQIKGRVYNFSSIPEIKRPRLFYERYLIQETILMAGTKETIYIAYDFSAKQKFNVGIFPQIKKILLLQEGRAGFDVQLNNSILTEEANEIVNLPQNKNVIFILFPSYEVKWNLSIDHPKIDLSGMGLDKKDYIDYQHFSKEGAVKVAKEICSQYKTFKRK